MAENKGKSKARRKALGLKHVYAVYALLALSFMLVTLHSSIATLVTLLLQATSVLYFIWAYMFIINNLYHDVDLVDKVINHFRMYAVLIPVPYFLLLFMSAINFVFFSTFYLLHNPQNNPIPLVDYVEVDFTATLTSATILVAINGWLFSTWTRQDAVRQNQQGRLMRIVRDTRDDVTITYIAVIFMLYYLLIFLPVKMGQPSLPSIFILSLIFAIPPALVVSMVLQILLAMVIIDVCTENPQMCTRQTAESGQAAK